MFALVIGFQDSQVDEEVLLVRRALARVGGGTDADVTIEDFADLEGDFLVVRGIGREAKFLFAGERTPDVPGLGMTTIGRSVIGLGGVTVTAIPLDVDLVLREEETPDRASARILRDALLNPSPEFPAVVIEGEPPAVVSFPKDGAVLLGRDRVCAVRLSSPEVSGRHARISSDHDGLWIEDVGSTNGTFLGSRQVSGRTELLPRARVRLGTSSSVFCALEAREIALGSESVETEEVVPVAGYPVLVSLSPVARPSRLVLPSGRSISIGRDQKSDLWLGDPHVSRLHCEVVREPDGAVSVIDHSTNGTLCDGGVTRRGERFLVKAGSAAVFEAGGTTFAICFSTEDERNFVASQGALGTFREVGSMKTTSETPTSGDPLSIRQRVRKLTTKTAFVFSPEGFKTLFSWDRVLVIALSLLALVILSFIAYVLRPILF